MIPNNLRTKAFAILAMSMLFRPALAYSERLESARITIVANVILRQMPSAESNALAYLPLGTRITEIEPEAADAKWIHVTLADKRDGWIYSSLTCPFDPAQPWPIFERIITNRLNQKGYGFQATVELTDFVERVFGDATDPAIKARFDLYYLRAIDAVLTVMRFAWRSHEPFSSWISRHKMMVIYNDPAGSWMLDNTWIWEVHERHAKTAEADEIAWLAATNGLTGECEGELTCYINWQDRLFGEYIRKHPFGKYAGEAIRHIKMRVDSLNLPPEPGILRSFDPIRDCGALVKLLDSLQSTIELTKSPDRKDAIKSLTLMKQRCLP